MFPYWNVCVKISQTWISGMDFHPTNTYIALTLKLNNRWSRGNLLSLYSYNEYAHMMFDGRQYESASFNSSDQLIGWLVESIPFKARTTCSKGRIQTMFSELPFRTIVPVPKRKWDVRCESYLWDVRRTLQSVCENGGAWLAAYKTQAAKPYFIANGNGVQFHFLRSTTTWT